MRFVASLRPAQWSSLLLLFGIWVLLHASSQPWLPRELDHELSIVWQGTMYQGPLQDQHPFSQVKLYRLLYWFRSVLLGVAVVSASAVVFLRISRPVRWLFLCVLLPAALPVGLFAVQVSVLTDSAEVRPLLPGFEFRPWPQQLLQYGSGLHFTLAGIVVLLVVTWLVDIGRLRLPIGFADAPARLPRGDWTDSARQRILVWLGVTILFVPVTFPARLWLASMWLPPMEICDPFIWSLATSGLVACLSLLFLGWLVRPDWKREFRRWLGPGRRNHYLLMLALPTVVAVLGFFSLHLYNEFQIYRGQPDSVIQLNLGYAWDAINEWYSYSLLFYPLTLLLSEMNFRGFLQTGLVARFGARHGIFLTGVLWFFFGFPGVVSAPWLGSELLSVVGNFAGALALSSLLGWTVRHTGSVLPGVLLRFGLLPLAWVDLGTSGGSVTDSLLLLLYALSGLVAWWLWRRYPVSAPPVTAEQAAPVP